jgi:transmembrane sensor
LQGEALFDVAHDANRPFDVQTLHGSLRAVGTQFDVDVHSGQTTVTVVEGRVAVASEAAHDDRGQESKAGKSNGSQSVLVLGASDRVVITRSGPGVPQHDANVNAAISWTWHQLVFEHRPLREVAAEFNRYSRHRIEIEGADLAQQEFTGVFQSNDPDSFVEFLATIPWVEVRHDADVTHIVLAHGKQRSSK